VTVRRTTLILTGLLTLFSSTLFGSYTPSEWDYYCRKCHIDRPVNALYDSSIKAHKDASISCVACHRDKGFAGHVRKSTEIFLRVFQDVTLPPAVPSRAPSSVTSDQCLACHAYIWEVDDIERRKLPKAVRPMLLRAAHLQHWEYREFTPELRDELKALTGRQLKSSLSKTEQDRLDRLSRIENMRCARCHQRFKKDSPGGVDSNVNIAMKNPMECTACHVALRTAVHPGDTSPLPSAVSCEQCHHGKLHQKMIFFPVDQGTEADCLLCHPKYSTEELQALKPGQFSHKSTEMLNPGRAKRGMDSVNSNATSYLGVPSSPNPNGK
jgi:hypothetical protein